MNLKTMAIGTLVLAVLAVAGVAMQRYNRAPTLPEHVGQPIMSADLITQARQVRVLGEEGLITLHPVAGQWTVENLQDFSANEKQLTEFVVKLSREPIERLVSDREEKLKELGLLSLEENGGKWEDKVTARRFTLVGDDGKTLFDLLIGNDRKGTSPGAFGGQYVRFGEEKAAYLVGSGLYLNTKAKDWMDRTVLDFDGKERIKSVTVAPAGAKPFTFSREKGEDQLAVAGVRAESFRKSEVNGMLDKLNKFTFELLAKPDATPTALGRAKTGTTRVETFDGRVYTLTVGEEKGLEDFRWVTVAASLREDVDDAALKTQIDAFNKRFSGRTLALYDWNLKRVHQPLADYLEKDRK